MVLPLPTWPFRAWLQLLYGLVWAAFIVITAVKDREVTAEMFGYLAAGLAAIQYALRDKADPPEEQ